MDTLGYDKVNAGFTVNDNTPMADIGSRKLWKGGYAVKGRIIDQNKNPVAGAQAGLNIGGIAITDGTGQFEISGIADAASFVVTVTKNGYTQETRGSVVSNSVPVRDIGTLSIVEGGYRATGRIVDIDKNPVSDVNLSLNVGGSALSGADGTFTVAGIMTGSAFTLTGTKNGYKQMSRNSAVSSSVPVRNMGDIYLIAEIGGYRVQGCVKDAGGNGMENVEISAGSEVGHTDTNGCYDIPMSNPGTYTVTATVTQDLVIPDPRNPGQTISVPHDSFSPVSKTFALSEANPVAIVASCVFSPNLRLGLQASATRVVDGGDIVYTVTLTNSGTAPSLWAEMWSEPELPGCWSFVSGYDNNNPPSALPHSTRPLQPYLVGINTPLNCNLNDDPGDSSTSPIPYPRVPHTGASFLVNYPFAGNPSAKTLECKEVAMLGAASSAYPNTTKVQVVVHADCGDGPGNPFELKFGAAGTPACTEETSCDTGAGTSAPPVRATLPQVLPQLNVALTGSVNKVRLGEGTDLSYTLTVRNEETATSVATGVTLTLPVPDGMAAAAVIDAAKGSCSLNGDITCNLNDLPGNNQAAVTVKYTPSAAGNGSIGGASLTSLDTAAQTLALNYSVLRELTECEKNPTCECNPAMCPVPPPPLADISIAMDDTGSMSEEIIGLKTALHEFITRVANETAKPVIQLVTFKDNYTHRVTTDNMPVLRDNYVNALTAAGGDECPENGAGALSWIAASSAGDKRLKDGGRILFITDASPYDNDDIDGLIANLRSRAIRVDVLLSGNQCIVDGGSVSAINVYSKIAWETGGFFAKAFDINDGTPKGARRYENTAFSVMMSSIFPVIIGMGPDSAPQGSTLDVTFTAANTNFNESTEVTVGKTSRTRSAAAGNAVIVNKVTVISATELVVNITISEDADAGFYDIQAKTRLGDQIETAEGRELLEITFSEKIPEIVSIAPISGLAGSQVTVSVSGTQTHFNASSQLSFGDPGIQVKQVRVSGAGSLSAALELTAEARLGLHDVTVSTGGEIATTRVESFLVIEESLIAKITALSAVRGVQGGMLKLDIVGKNTSFADGVSEVSFSGTGITVLSMTVSSAINASATLLIDADAPLGYQDVFLRTNDETAVMLNGFAVSEAGPYAVQGYVLDQTGDPVEKVYLSIDGQGVFTDATGYYRMSGLVEGEYTVAAEKIGYNFSSRTFNVSVNILTANVTLKAVSAIDIDVTPDTWAPINPGRELTYTVTVTNKGAETATGVMLTDILPEGASLKDIAASDGGACDAAALRCVLPDLAPGGSVTATVVIYAPQADTPYPQGTWIANTVIASTDQYPPATKKTWHKIASYLTVSLSDTPDPVVPQGVLRYTASIELSPHAPSEATGVRLAMRLPETVELRSVTTEYGDCDVSNAPTVTCDLIDLSVDSADSISYITVNAEVVLTDPGLLLLISEATVTANEYPAYRDRERTKIFIGGVKADMIFVIDVTGSMREEINGVINAIMKFIAQADL
ncbi:MAG: DUF11 domain-containing protein, partial [Gammaproteobacteria bacterium]|nr:DUF11 domain-containing protein [Gammaproteobacteria bacterium]